MTDQPEHPQQGEPTPQEGAGPVFERVQQSSVSARVPPGVAEGVFATAAIVQEGPNEFVIDFIQGIAKPARVAARVVMSPAVMGQFARALRENLGRYEQSFGPPKPLPTPGREQRPNIRELYEQLKLPDEQLSGVYANVVMVAHTASEFYFDFITRFLPVSAVSGRVYMAASQVPRLLETLSGSYQRHMRRTEGQPPSPPPGPEDAQPPQQ